MLIESYQKQYLEMLQKEQRYKNMRIKQKHDRLRYKGKPCWTAINALGGVSTFADLSAVKNCDFANAHDFIISQLLLIDSINEFATIIGYDGQEKAMLNNFIKNDRNPKFWKKLAVEWFDASYMGDINHE